MSAPPKALSNRSHDAIRLHDHVKLRDPAQPHDANGPVFREAWEAHAFAMTLDLHGRGLFTWDEWTRTVSAEIAKSQSAGDPDLGDTDYHHWLAALESIVASKGLTSADELMRYQAAWDHAADRTPHGQPIELKAADFDSGPPVRGSISSLSRSS